MRPGQYIRIAGQGLPGHGGEPAGDLYLEVRIAPHPVYRVDGQDLSVDLPVTPSEAALGAEVEVPLPGGGTGAVRVPPNARAGLKLRLKGRGLGGDLYLVLAIALPPADSDAARTAYEQLAKATAGRVTWCGDDIARKPDALRRELGYLPQDFGVYEALSAREFLAFLAAVKGLPARTVATRVDECLAMVGLDDVADKRLGGYSGGMRQRVGIAQALLNDPKLLIVDEPTVGLDPEERVRFRHLLAELAGTPGITTRRLDVCDPAAIRAFAAEVPAPSVLFNCAGYVHAGTVLDCSEDDFDVAVTLNVRSMYRMIRAFLPGMLEAGGGSIINMSSVASSLIGAPNRFIYGTTKAAVIGLTKSVAADYVTRGIRVNAICPGTVDSPSLHDRMRAMGDYDTARAAFIARQPMGRLGTAAEVAKLAVYLASDDSSFMTGQAIAIDGGWTNT